MRRGGEATSLREGVGLGVLDAGGKSAVVAGEHLGALLREFFVDARDDRFFGEAEPPGEQAEHDVVFRELGAGGLHGDLLHRHGDGDGRRGLQRDGRGLDLGLCLVDDDCVLIRGQLTAKAEEVLPVERDGDIERTAWVEHGGRGDAEPAGGFTTANLGAETLGQDGKIALLGGGANQRLACRYDAVATRTSHANNQIVQHNHKVFEGEAWGSSKTSPRGQNSLR